GTNLGTVSAGSRSSATNNVKVGTHQIADTNVTIWTPTLITFLTDSSAVGDTDTDWGANFGGASALTVTSGSQAASGLNFYVFPQITSVTQPAGFAADTAREYDAADTDGVITLNGTRFGSSQGTGSATIVAQTATINSWINTAIQAQVSPAIVDTVNTGSISMTQGAGANGKTHTYAGTLRVLPRITGFTPTSASEGGAVTVNGNHFCQGVSCPVAFSASDKVTFTSARDATTFTSWSATAMATTVPVGAVTGNVVLTSNAYTSNGKSFTVLSNTPSDPTSLDQFKDVGFTQSIAVGGTASSTPIYLKQTMEVPGISGGTLYPQFEYQLIGAAFSCVGGGVCGSAVEGTGSASPGPATGSKSITPADGSYHWQARTRHNKTGADYYSNWVSFGGNSDPNGIDFTIDTTAPTITNVSSGTPGSNSATITWNTSGELSTSQVEYGTDSGLVGSSLTTLDQTMVLNHSVALVNLNSGTVYYFRVKSKDAAGNLATSSPIQSFSTTSITQPAKTTQTYIVGNTGIISAPTTWYFTLNAPETSLNLQSAYLEVYGLVFGGTNPIDLQVNAVPVSSYSVSAANATFFKFLYKIPNQADLNLNDTLTGGPPATCAYGSGGNPPCNNIVVTPGAGMSVYISSAKLIFTYSYTP
ncbi:fibronectin type III domain-containing protein, partial [Candidatus Azambacteria bacterium]|nr:fibronectin type III domain-containing protein [Candidatus Azambacteria bacterium]